MGMSLDFDVDLEKGIFDHNNIYTKSLEKPLILLENDVSPVKWSRSERKKPKSASKPPRPPRGPSLDAADQKLIREIAELAMLKRARIERMRALKKSREAKSASAGSSLGNVLATLFTAVFFFLLILQGLSPNGKSSVVDMGKGDGDFISVQYAGNPSASVPDEAYTGPVLAQRLPKYVGSLSG